MKNKLICCVPPGTDGQKAFRLFLGLGIAGFCYSSMHYFLSLAAAISKLYHVVNRERVLIPEMMMPSFGQVIRGSFFWILPLLVYALAYALGNYVSFFRESRSIYVMKRLPDRTETFRRCTAIPLFGIGLAGLGALLLLSIFCLLYRHLPPEGRALPVHFIEFMRAMVW